MKIDFNNIQEKELPEFKGGLLHMNARIHDDGEVKIMSNRLVPGASIGYHAHADSCEVIFITSGTGIATMDGVEEILHAGDCHYCPKGMSHELKNTGDDNLCFLAVVPAMK